MIRNRNFSTERAALTLPEALFIGAICVTVALFLLMRLPRGREQARATACLSNLNQIGQAMGYYAQSTGVFPENPLWTPPIAEPGTSVLWTMRNHANLWNFVDVRREIEGKSGKKTGEKPAAPAGLRCPSDRASAVPGATNYRANAGSEKSGTDGPFAIGKRVTPHAVEAADGMAFTAAFAERLIGTGAAEPGPADYRLVERCDDTSEERSKTGSLQIEKDAGHDWSRGDWIMSLYQHGIRPNSPNSAVATRENCANMGSSSGHQGSVHVLLLDGSARSWRDKVDATVWRRLGGFSDSSLPEKP
ncbi:DUF1559 domain-containing protein [bacterium]|nr:DUF1559 domain-containing protein [bacterium]